MVRSGEMDKHASAEPHNAAFKMAVSTVRG
jgi:hypothetical protein